ncbi:MAG: hypothetical protein Q7S66_03765 [bacterium]|nr:hypothetical protein [bacterium]
MTVSGNIKHVIIPHLWPIIISCILVGYVLIFTIILYSAPNGVGNISDKVKIVTQQNSNIVETRNNEGSVSINKISEKIQPNLSQFTNKPFSYLVKQIGAYPSGDYSHSSNYFDNFVIFLQKEPLKYRLKKLLGDEKFAVLHDYWDVTMPIEQIGKYIVARACGAHQCPDVRFAVIVDIANDTIFVGYKTRDDEQLFAENDATIPKILEQWQGDE